MLDNYVQRNVNIGINDVLIVVCTLTHVHIHVHMHTPSQVLVENMNSKGKATECIQ